MYLCVSGRIGKLDSIPSAILVAAQLLFDCPSEALQHELMVPILTAVLPWSMLHHQAIRSRSHHSQDRLDGNVLQIYRQLSEGRPALKVSKLLSRRHRLLTP